jgi:hypothetical protein
MDLNEDQSVSDTAEATPQNVAAEDNGTLLLPTP